MNFVTLYFIIGTFLYLTFVSLMYIVGIDNIKNMINNEDIKDVDVESPKAHIIFMFFLILIWPITIMWLINENTKNNF